MDVEGISSSFVSIDRNFNLGLVSDSDPSRTFNSDPILTFVLDSSPIFNFDTGSAYDSDADPVLDSNSCLAINSDFATNHSSDLNEAEAENFVITNMDVEMLKKVDHNFISRLSQYIEENGGQFQDIVSKKSYTSTTSGAAGQHVLSDAEQMVQFDYDSLIDYKEAKKLTSRRAHMEHDERVTLFNVNSLINPPVVD
ncbi:hypothetical protein EVAR_21007_1 [Eumeta japonica]|uniref:Uncharacterized protein n=1 Tax=Eumeta variegata TaxID=151549 RepID=A0A4C1V685_EUMVA|nr:hypothetical protein EVAR_21007_1 [Eumeta japonica]